MKLDTKKLLALADEVETGAKALVAVLRKVETASGLPIMAEHVADLEARLVVWVPRRLRSLVNPPSPLTEAGAYRRAVALKAAVKAGDEAKVADLVAELGLLGATTSVEGERIVVLADNLSVEV